MYCIYVKNDRKKVLYYATIYTLVSSLIVQGVLTKVVALITLIAHCTLMCNACNCCAHKFFRVLYAPPNFCGQFSHPHFGTPATETLWFVSDMTQIAPSNVHWHVAFSNADLHAGPHGQGQKRVSKLLNELLSFRKCCNSAWLFKQPDKMKKMNIA